MKETCLPSQEIENRLKQAGVNPTAQRIAICRYVLCEADHPTADDVKAWVDQNFPKMSLATVYNTLHILVKAGLLKELRFSHTDKAVYDSNVDDHYHFLDEATGQLFDVPKEKIKIDSTLKETWKVNHVEVLLQGHIG